VTDESWREAVLRDRLHETRSECLGSQASLKRESGPARSRAAPEEPAAALPPEDPPRPGRAPYPLLSMHRYGPEMANIANFATVNSLVINNGLRGPSPLLASKPCPGGNNRPMCVS
jgi:hypothetical protein